jgi:L-fuconolactonase
MIVDSHVHVATADVDRYPLRPTGVGSDWWRSGADVESLTAGMDAAGVDRAVLVQAVGAYGFDCRYVLDSASERLAVVDAVDLDETVDLRPGVAGTRLFGVSSPETPAWLTDGRAGAVWDAAAELGTTLVATLWERDVPLLRPLLERQPSVPVALDHCGFPEDPTRPVALDLAELPSLHLKVSTHVLAHVEDPAAFVALLAGRFGAERLAWGSDFPQTFGSYEAMLALGRDASRHLGDADRDHFLGGTAHRLWFA